MIKRGWAILCIVLALASGWAGGFALAVVLNPTAWANENCIQVGPAIKRSDIRGLI